MTFTKFEELLHTKYPEASACMHGKFAQTEHNNKVEIHFNKFSKCYLYYGSYIQILNRLGIKTVYKADIDMKKAEIARLREENGQPNPFFEGDLIDNTLVIKDIEADLKMYEDEHYIVVD